MCGRYYIATEDSDEQLRELLSALREQDAYAVPEARLSTGEIFPGSVVPALTAQGPMCVQWGFTGYQGKGLTINARCETAASKPTFAQAFAHWRCLLPASYYYEWDAQKRRYLYAPPDGVIFLAGLLRQERDAPLPRAVILTRDAPITLLPIHDRVPVTIPQTKIDDWLCGAAPEALFHLPVPRMDVKLA